MEGWVEGEERRGGRGEERREGGREGGREGRREKKHRIMELCQYRGLIAGTSLTCSTSRVSLGRFRGGILPSLETLYPSPGNPEIVSCKLTHSFTSWSPLLTVLTPYSTGG